MNSLVSAALISADKYDAVLFDLDGVLTPTAKVHAACWKRLFDNFLQQHAQRNHTPFKPFDIQNDYRQYVDGKPRYEGVESFLASRDIHLPYDLPYGPEAAAANEMSVRELGNRKDQYFEEILESEGIEAFEGAIALVKYLRAQGIKTAVVSSSRNCQRVLAAAGISNLFDSVMDGKRAEELQLAGKPAPDTFITAADQVGATAIRSVVVEDAIAGVRAGKNGHFGLVIGVALAQNADELIENGADLVVADLSELLPKARDAQAQSD